MIQHVAGRAGFSLAGQWRAVVDPYEAGYRSPWGDPWPLGWYRNLPVRPGIAEVDFARADLLHVPGDWNSQDPRLLFYEGAVWYQRRFRLFPVPGRRHFLHFGAVAQRARVWLDAEPLGEHEGGFTPFAFEITGHLGSASDEQVLTVMVDTTRRADSIPARSTDWWNYGGITRDVRVVDVPETFVRETFVHLDPGGTDRIRGFVVLDGPEREQEVTVALPELGLEWRGRTDGGGRAQIELPVPAGRLERWSPEHPRRYEVVVSSADDRLAEPVGFRTLAVRGHEILLNGEPVFLRGISLHEEAPTEPRRAFGEDDARTLLGWARELGCNFVRLAHYPHDEATVRLADEMGLLVWAELPVYWRIAWENPETLANARQQLTELVARDRNRACVALWSLTNESPASPPRLHFVRALAEHARAMDPTRLLTAALMARHEPGEDGRPPRMVLDDPVGELLDVTGCNEYLGWYYGSVEEVPRVEWETAYEKPLLMSELGAGALHGHHGAADLPFTEEHQAAVYEAQVAMLRRIPFLAGLSPWILKDFRSPRRVLAGIQDYFNRKGLVSERGHRKLAFGVLQRYYRELAGATSAPR